MTRMTSREMRLLLLAGILYAMWRDGSSYEMRAGRLVVEAEAS